MRKFLNYILLVLTTCFLTVFFIFLLEYSIKLFFSNSIANSLNQLGGFLGGIFGPFLSLVTILILLKSNSEQNRNRKDDLEREKEKFTEQLESEKLKLTQIEQNFTYNKLSELIFKQLELANIQINDIPFRSKPHYFIGEKKYSSILEFVCDFLRKIEMEDKETLSMRFEIVQTNFISTSIVSQIINQAFYLIENSIEKSSLIKAQKDELLRIFCDNLNGKFIGFYEINVPIIISNKQRIKKENPNKLNQRLLMIDQAYKNLNLIKLIELPAENTIMFHFPEIKNDYPAPEELR